MWHKNVTEKESDLCCWWTTPFFSPEEQLLRRIMKKSDSGDDKTGNEESVVKKSAPEFFVRSLRASDLGSRIGYVSDPSGLDRYRRFGNDYLARCQFHKYFTLDFFCTQVFCEAFLYLQFGFVFFWHKEIGAKAARKMLVKLTTDRSDRTGVANTWLAPWEEKVRVRP